MFVIDSCKNIPLLFRMIGLPELLILLDVDFALLVGFAALPLSSFWLGSRLFLGISQLQIFRSGTHASSHYCIGKGLHARGHDVY